MTAPIMPSDPRFIDLPPAQQRKRLAMQALATFHDKLAKHKRVNLNLAIKHALDTVVTATWWHALKHGEEQARQRCSFVRCMCGRRYDEKQWRRLRFVGIQRDVVDSAEDLECRDCKCGSTLSVYLVTQ